MIEKKCVLITGLVSDFPEWTNPDIEEGYMAAYFSEGEPIAIGWGPTLNEARDLADQQLNQLIKG